MIICPACQHENVDGTQFCEMCGEELPQATAAASDEKLVTCPQCGHENPADNLICEACGAELHPGVAPAIAGDVASAGVPNAVLAPPLAPTLAPPLASAASPGAPPLGAAMDATPANPDPTGLVDPTNHGTADPGAALPAGDLKPGNVKLVVEQGQTVGAQFVLGDNELLVGREDEEEEIYPDIDLSDQDAGYVHRRHATINFQNGNLSVTHLGGSNKTRINNKPIPDNVAQPVKLGDKIAFGKVVLRLLPA